LSDQKHEQADGAPLVPTADRQSQSRIGDLAFKYIVMAAAVSVVVLVVLLAIELFQGSSSALTTFGFSFFISTTWDPVHSIFGALPFIYGTLVTSVIALIIGVPISLGVAIFLSEIMKERRRVADYLGSVVELLAAVPSVVFGLWALFILSPMVRDYIEMPLHNYLGFLPIFQGTPFGLDFLTAGIILSIMIIPTVSAISREVLRSVPNSQREALIALGATKWDMVRRSVLPYARSGLFGAIILGLGRAVGETMAVTMVIGNSPSITASIIHPGYTLASVIANEFTEATSQLYVSALVEIGLTLFFVALAINIFARLLVWRITRFSKVRT
jgi:phosphate transport system permease protein